MKVSQAALEKGEGRRARLSAGWVPAMKRSDEFCAMMWRERLRKEYLGINLWKREKHGVETTAHRHHHAHRVGDRPFLPVALLQRGCGGCGRKSFAHQPDPARGLHTRVAGGG